MIESTPTVSVIITCYNYGHYVAKAIESVLSQTRPANEIIVVDDGSTDNSRDVIRAFGGHLRTIFKENEGHKATKDKGFAAATGSLILFLDADDLLYPTALEEAVACFGENVVKVQFDLDVIDGDGNLLGRRACNFPKRVTPEDVRSSFEATGHYIWPVTSGNVFSRTLLQRVLPYEGPFSHDGALNTVAPLYGDIVTISHPLGQYRMHNNNISRQGVGAEQYRHPPFAKRISLRLKEFDLLRHHARALGHALPPGDLLDNDPLFVNYRLMSIRLGLNYEGRDKDRAVSLFKRGVHLAVSSNASTKKKLADSIWLLAIWLSRGRLSRLLVHGRYERAELLKRFRFSIPKKR